jgi:hypothetical protein
MSKKKAKGAQEHKIELMRLQGAMRLSAFRSKVEPNKKAYNRTERKREDREEKSEE